MNTTRTPKIRHRVAAAATALLVVGATLTGIAIGTQPAGASAGPSAYAAGWLTSTANSVSSWSSTGGKPAITRHVGNVFTVEFPGITGAFGVAAVTPGNDNPGGMCMLNGQGLVNNVLTVSFHCANRQGIAVDRDFTITYTSITGPDEGWVDADQPSFSGVYHPAARYNSNSADVTIAHNASFPGQYRITFPQLGGLASFGSDTVTPMLNGFGHCTNGSQLWDDHTVIDVYCFDANGAPADMRFSMHFVGKRAVLGTTTPKSGWALYPNFWKLGRFSPTKSERFTSNGQKVTINHTAIGAYTFTFMGLAAKTSRGAQAYASQGPGSGDVRCGAFAEAKGSDALVTVKCVNAIGTPADTTVTANYFGI